MKIEKSDGVTQTENLLTQLCENTFLKLWSYPNPFKADGDEMCDLIAVFGNEVFLFFDRKNTALEEAEVDADYMVKWGRWKRKTVDRQLKTAHGAERYLRNKGIIFLDPKLEQQLPVPLPDKNLIVHKIIVAHGAGDACKNFSEENISGSLAIAYGSSIPANALPPFFISLDRENPVHVFDSANLHILMGELDTVADLSAYLTAKDDAIRRYKGLSYCAEEDLLAMFFLNFDESKNQHFIGVDKEDVDFLHIGEGEWEGFKQKEEYVQKKEKDRISYLWDHYIQKTSNHALDGTLLGDNAMVFKKSAIHEMAREPRFFRRFLAEHIMKAADAFPDPAGKGIMRQITYLPSFSPDKGYVFLQLIDPEEMGTDVYRERRRNLLGIACGAAKNKFPELKTVVGIATEPPKFFGTLSEDFLLLDCTNWTDKEKKMYEEANEPLGFFATGKLQAAKFSEF